MRARVISNLGTLAAEKPKRGPSARTIARTASAEAHRKLYDKVAFSFRMNPGATARDIYHAAFEAAQANEYEPAEFAAIEALVSYSLNLTAKRALEIYGCVRAGLQAAMGEDVSIVIRWKREPMGVAGALVDVREAK